MDAESGAPAPPGLVPTVEHATKVNTSTRIVLPPSLSHAAKRAHAHALSSRRNSSMRGPSSSNTLGARSMRTGAAAAFSGRNNITHGPNSSKGGTRSTWTGAAARGCTGVWKHGLKIKGRAIKPAQWFTSFRKEKKHLIPLIIM
jgi:hypothetical protein